MKSLFEETNQIVLQNIGFNTAKNHFRAVDAYHVSDARSANKNAHKT